MTTLNVPRPGMPTPVTYGQAVIASAARNVKLSLDGIAEALDANDLTQAETEVVAIRYWLGGVRRMRQANQHAGEQTLTRRYIQGYLTDDELAAERAELAVIAARITNITPTRTEEVHHARVR